MRARKAGDGRMVGTAQVAVVFLMTTVVGVVVWLAGTSAGAATISWTNTADGSFTAPGNWNPNTVPTSGDTADFSLAGSRTVTVSQTVTNGILQAYSGSETFNLSGNTYLLNDSAFGFKLANNAAGATVTITNGTLEVVNGAILGITGTGTVNVTGSGSVLQFDSQNYLYWGYTSPMQINVQNGGHLVNNSGYTPYLGVYSPGVVNISGSGSVWSNTALQMAHYTYGADGSATVKLSDGGQYVGTFIYGAAYGNTHMAAITITDTGSVMRLSNILYVGDGVGGGMGTMTISNGGAANLGWGLIAGNNAAGNGTITVQGPGSSLSNSQLTVIGVFGTGSMIISNKGYVYSRYGFGVNGNEIAQLPGSTGTVTVVGSGSKWYVDAGNFAGALNVGGSSLYGTEGGVATLAIGTGAVVQSTRDVNVFGKGTVDMQGGTLQAGLNITFKTNSLLEGSGTIVGNTTEQGTLSPGHSIGSLTFSNSLTLTSTSTSLFEFASASSFDQVSVVQNFTAGGVLNLQFDYAADTNNFTYFKIFSVSGTGGGSFSQINWLGTPPEGGYRAGFVGNDFVVTAIPEPSAVMFVLLGAGIVMRCRRVKWSR